MSKMIEIKKKNINNNNAYIANFFNADFLIFPKKKSVTNSVSISLSNFSKKYIKIVEKK